MFVNFYNIYLKNNINDNFLLDDSVKLFYTFNNSIFSLYLFKLYLLY